MSDDIGRAAQLLNKTNQMNLRTRRMTGDQLASWAEGEDREVWTVRVADRFGDAGLCGLLGLKGREGRGDVTNPKLAPPSFPRFFQAPINGPPTLSAQWEAKNKLPALGACGC